jgi:hypothetical protein
MRGRGSNVARANANFSRIGIGEHIANWILPKLASSILSMGVRLVGLETRPLFDVDAFAISGVHT